MINSVKTYISIVGFGGLLRALKAKASKSTVIYTMYRRDCKYPFGLRIPSSDILAYRQVFIDQEYEFIAPRSPKVIVDAGANIGLASIFFANKFPEAKIIAMEPEESNFEMLSRNVEFYPNVFPIQAALWHKNEQLNLIDPGSGKWGFRTEAIGPSARERGEVCHVVAAMTVDRVMEDHNIDNIDILKIDIEGAEKEVFSDPSRWIGKANAIIIELHERMKAGCNRSFYAGSNGFDNEWTRGENVYLSRNNYLLRRSA